MNQRRNQTMKVILTTRKNSRTVEMRTIFPYVNVAEMKGTVLENVHEYRKTVCVIALL
jgi:hypothetical protein